MKEILLELQNISKSYSGNVVLKDINLKIYKGKVHALMGENGAGKSTLVKIITGVVKPNNGTMEYDGRAGSRN